MDYTSDSGPSDDDDSGRDRDPPPGKTLRAPTPWSTVPEQRKQRQRDILYQARKLSVSAQDSHDRIRRDANAWEAEYRRRREDTIKRSEELRAELLRLEDDQARRLASGKRSVKEGVPRHDKRMESHLMTHKNFVCDAKSPLSFGLQAVAWPHGFKMPQLNPYDGKSDPKAFLMSFEAAIQFVGGDEVTMAKSLVMAITRIA